MQNRTPMQLKTKSLYAITPPLAAGVQHDQTLQSMCEQAILGGVSIIQYRDKTATPSVQARRATMLAALCRQTNTLFIINDSPALAKQCAADGVHIGKEDGTIAAAKACGGMVGVSCQNDITRAMQAEKDGADYIALGAVYPTTSKDNTTHCPLSTIAEAKKQCTVPIVAVGGINENNIANVLAAGADIIAVSHALFHASNITATARNLCMAMQ